MSHRHLPDRRQAGSPSPSPFTGRRDRTPTEEPSAVPASAFLAVPAAARVSTPTRPTGSRELRTDRLDRLHERRARAERRRQARRRHLRAALTALALAAALLTWLQLYAAQGITQARQAALAARSARVTAQAGQAAAQTSTERAVQPAAPQPTAPTSRPAWVTEDTGAAYDRTDPAASPLDLPRCTTSPDTPMPCLAHVSADSRRVVILEEDASLTALVRQ